MTIVLAAAIFFDRRMNIAAGIALAALLILLINPTALFSASFQLSFAAVIGLAAVAPLLRRKIQAIKSADNFWHKILKWVIFSLLTSIIATVSTAPLTVYHFNRLSLLSPLSTLLIEPLLCFWSLIIGLAGSCFIFISPLTAAFLFKIGSWGIIGATSLAEVLARLPFTCIWFTTPSLFEVLCAYIFLLCLLFFPRHYLIRFAAIGLLLFLIIWPNWLRIMKNRSEASIVTVLDVGQGCAVVMELCGGRTILLDGGGSRTRKFNVGKALIAPFLWQRRIKNIDDVIISHPDGDHFNGLPFILERFQPRTLWINGQPGNKLYKILLSQAQESGIKIKIPEKNCVITQHNDNILLNLTEMHDNNRYPNLKDNDRSLIIKLMTAKVSFLFPGDIEKEAEKTAVENNYKLKSDIMLAPHHGSKTSSSEIFLQAVQPEKIIISAAAHKYGTFPATEVIKRYHKQNISILTTSKNGTISYRITPEKMDMETFKEPNFGLAAMRR
jgi:competence protein ComEC